MFAMKKETSQNVFKNCVEILPSGSSLNIYIFEYI